MENGFLCTFIGKFPGEDLKKWSCFFGRNIPNGDSCYICDLSLIPVTGKKKWFVQIVNTIPKWTLLTREPTGFPIRYFRNDKKKINNKKIKKKKTGAEMRPAIGSGIATGDAPVSYWPIFSLSLVRVPEAFMKVKSAKFSSCF